MAIATKPKRKSADDFIAGAGVAEANGEPEDEKQVTTIRISKALLKRIDERARRHGISRTAYILMAASKAVEDGL